MGLVATKRATAAAPPLKEVSRAAAWAMAAVSRACWPASKRATRRFSRLLANACSCSSALAQLARPDPAPASARWSRRGVSATASARRASSVNRGPRVGGPSQSNSASAEIRSAASSALLLAASTADRRSPTWAAVRPTLAMRLSSTPKCCCSASAPG